MKINFLYSELNEKLNNLRKERSDYLDSKSIEIRNFLSNRDSSNYNENPIIEELKEVDRHVEGLEHIISTSVNIALSIIKPVSEREKCITNISKTVELLEIENNIKAYLKKFKTESKIDNKIKLILKANDLIKINQAVFNNFREVILKESQRCFKIFTEFFQ